jgi:hypothetical protein
MPILILFYQPLCGRVSVHVRDHGHDHGHDDGDDDGDVRVNGHDCDDGRVLVLKYMVYDH